LNFPFFIARRYFFSRKNTNVINIISFISILGVAVGSFALIVILSVFNGMEDIAVSNFNSFDPELKIEQSGKTNFEQITIAEKLKGVNEIESISYTLTENALVKYQNKQHPFKIKGVDANFEKITGIDTMIIRGKFDVSDTDVPYAVIGYTVEYHLAVGVYLMYPLNIYLPKRNGKISVINPESAFKKVNVFPSGVYGIDKSIDDFILVPLEFLQKNADLQNLCDAVDIKLKKDTDIGKVKQRIANIVGDEFIVKDRFQQHEFIYKVLKSEKSIVFLILIFILLIASFNIIGSIAMLILDKEHDIFILKSIGILTKNVKRIYVFEGWLISQTGIIIGVVLGVVVVWLQSKYGFITIGDGTKFIVNAYPIKFKYADLIYVYFTVSAIGLVASYLPVLYVFKKRIKQE